MKTRGEWALVWASVAWVNLEDPNLGRRSRTNSLEALGLPSIILYTLAARDGLGNHVTAVATDPYLPDALLYEWIATVTILFSVGFARVGAMCYILDV